MRAGPARRRAARAWDSRRAGQFSSPSPSRAPQWFEMFCDRRRLREGLITGIFVEGTGEREETWEWAAPPFHAARPLSRRAVSGDASSGDPADDQDLPPMSVVDATSGAGVQLLHDRASWHPSVRGAASRA